MTKLFILGPDNNGDGVYTLVSEHGEGLASHLCSHAGYAEGDLEADRPERQKEWKEKFGEYQVMWFKNQSEISIEELIKRNKEFHDKLNEEQNDAVSDTTEAK